MTDCGVTGERRMTGDHLVREHADGVDVCAVIDPRIARHLLRRHVRRSTERDAEARERDARRLVSVVVRH
jgi:hypothetical protein